MLAYDYKNILINMYNFFHLILKFLNKIMKNQDTILITGANRG